MRLTVIHESKGAVRELAFAEGPDALHLVYEPPYRKGDAVRLTVEEPGLYQVRLEDTLPPTQVYLPGNEAIFPIPFGVDRAGFSPRSFGGKRHFIEVRKEEEGAGGKRRDLALNPHDQTENRGIYPHMLSNVRYADSLRNKIFPDRGLFAPRNVIDGILANESHRLYPHQSWGINRDPNAYLTCDFGREVDIDTLRLAIRGEFPHDNYWVRAAVRCSDGSEEEIALEKTLEMQSFPMERKGIRSLTLCNLVKSGELSPFPALSLLEIYGKDSL